MFKKNLNKFLFIGALAASVFASCKKEELLEPNEVPVEGKTIIYIRAVDKDSSVVESEQVLLR